MKRIKDKLTVLVEYNPNTEEDDYELSITVNGGDTHTLTAFGCRLADMTLNEILQDVKEVIKEELGL